MVSEDVGDVADIVKGTEGCFIAERNATEIASRLSEAISFIKTHAKTNGRERIIELGLDSKQVAKRIVEIYGFAKSKNGRA